MTRISRGLAYFFATAAGAGFAPKAPGTFGSAVGIALVLAVQNQETWVQLIFWLSLLIVGTWSAMFLDRETAIPDNQIIVIDEVIGIGITACTAGPHWSTLLWSFLFFRFFDIVKLPPVRDLDQWSKSHSPHNASLGHWFRGFGVIADDIVAGIQGLCVIYFLQRLQWLP